MIYSPMLLQLSKYQSRGVKPVLSDSESTFILVRNSGSLLGARQARHRCPPRRARGWSGSATHR